MREHNLIAWMSILGMLLARLAAAGTVESELIELERERSRAIQAGDIAFLERLYTDDFSGVTTTGQAVDRAVLMSVFRNFDAARSPPEPSALPTSTFARRDDGSSLPDSRRTSRNPETRAGPAPGPGRPGGG